MFKKAITIILISLSISGFCQDCELTGGFVTTVNVRPDHHGGEGQSVVEACSTGMGQTMCFTMDSHSMIIDNVMLLQLVSEKNNNDTLYVYEINNPLPIYHIDLVDDDDETVDQILLLVAEKIRILSSACFFMDLENHLTPDALGFQNCYISATTTAGAFLGILNARSMDARLYAFNHLLASLSTLDGLCNL